MSENDSESAATLHTISDDLLNDLRPLHFSPPVTHVYNPLEYAREPYNQYLDRYAKPPKTVVLIGMNPGPWGMTQTGIPFGEVKAVKEWLGIDASVKPPGRLHPNRPVQGFLCKRSEVSGRRLWGWARETFDTPQRFFSRFFVANYCPLLFIEETGHNRTPDHLKVDERKPLLLACDRALRRTIRYLSARYVIGIGRFAEERARSSLIGLDVVIGYIAHPSSANPKSNRNWKELITRQLKMIGVQLF